MVRHIEQATLMDRLPRVRRSDVMFRPLDEASAPSWFRHSRDFLRVVDQGLVELTPWYLMEHAQVLDRVEGLKVRYPDRELVPFARRDDNDDLACWERDRVGVVMIHDFASPGFEDRRAYGGFWDWFRAAVEDMIEFEP